MESTITDISPQKANKNRVNIFINEEYTLSLSAEAALDLIIGQSLSSQDIGRLQAKDLKARTREFAINYLSYRPRSTAELRKHMVKKGFLTETIELVIAELTESNLLNDLEFAQYWVEQREEFKPRGLYALRYELIQKGIDQSIIERSLAEVDEYKSAMNAGRKKANQLFGIENELFIRKLSQHLERRGFSYEIIADATRGLWKEASLNQEEKSFSKGE
jgi:regulatory protein